MLHLLWFCPVPAGLIGDLDSPEQIVQETLQN